MSVRRASRGGGFSASVVRQPVAFVSSKSEFIWSGWGRMGSANGWVAQCVRAGPARGGHDPRYTWPNVLLAQAGPVLFPSSWRMFYWPGLSCSQCDRGLTGEPRLPPRRLRTFHRRLLPADGPTQLPARQTGPRWGVLGGWSGLTTRPMTVAVGSVPSPAFMGVAATTSPFLPPPGIGVFPIMYACPNSGAS